MALQSSTQPLKDTRSVLQRAVTAAPASTAQDAPDQAAAPIMEPVSRVGRTLEDMLKTPPHHRRPEIVEEIEHVLTKWSKYGADLPRAARLELCKHMSFAYFSAGETIFRQGDTGEHFYIILSGIVDVLVNDGGPDSEDKTVAHLMAGASFGELALMQGHGQRRATCRCAQRTELFVVNINDFKRILQPLQQDTLQNKIAFLKEVSQFRDLPLQTIENIALVLTEKVFPPKSVIYYQGNEVEDLFFIQRGHIKMIRETMMDSKARPSTAPAASSVTALRPPASVSTAQASIPAYLQEQQERKASRSSGPAKENQRRSRSRRSPNIAAVQDMIPGYHKLSLDIIRSMTAERPKTTPAAIGRLPKTGRRAVVSTAAAADLGTQSALSSTTALPAIKVGQAPLRKGVSFAADSKRKQNVLSAIAPGQTQQKQQQKQQQQQQQQQHQQQQAATSKKGWLLSEASLSHAVIQHLDFNLQHQAQQHLFLEVENLGHHQFFGDVAVLKSPIAQTTAVTANVTTTLLVISKWDLVKRAPDDLLEFIGLRGKESGFDDSALQHEYSECQKWQRFRRDLVEEVVQQHKAYKNNNPAYIWSGSFRDQIPYLASSDQRQWIPSGPRAR